MAPGWGQGENNDLHQADLDQAPAVDRRHGHGGRRPAGRGGAGRARRQRRLALAPEWLELQQPLEWRWVLLPELLLPPVLSPVLLRAAAGVLLSAAGLLRHPVVRLQLRLLTGRRAA